MSGSEHVVCINAGSSSLKMSSFTALGAELRRDATASLSGIGLPEGRLAVKVADGSREIHAVCIDYVEAFDLAWSRLQPHCSKPSVVGHRFVHGGSRFTAPTLVTDAVVRQLRELTPLAPLHLPPALALLEASRTRWNDVPHVLCFDTAFHADLPEIARRLPLPDRFPEVRRYGFHGLSYENVVHTLGGALGRRAVLAHLGSGSSLVALEGGRSVDTSMGFTPAGGILMGTRPGDLDPGVLLYLARQHSMSLDQLEAMIEHESGLMALAGTSDMQALLGARDQHAPSRTAVAMFVQGVRKMIGAYAAVLGGIDTLVFTGGIGEHSAEVRGEICEPLAFLGIQVDSEKNARHQSTIHAGSGTCAVHVVPTREDLAIARHAVAASH